MAKIPSEVDPQVDPAHRIGARPPRTRVWQDGRTAAGGFPVAEISDWLERPDTFVWLDLCAPEAKDLHVIGEELNLDPVAVEDAVNAHERAKLDRYRDYLFLNVYSAGLDDRGRIRLHEISAFITRRALVTVRQDTGFDVDALVDLWDDTEDLAPNGVAYLLHGLLDMVVDRQLDTVQTLDTELDDLSDLLFDDAFPAREIQERSFALRRNLVALRRVMLPMREILNTLLRRDLHVVGEAMTPYYQDAYDHAMHAAEGSDSMRELISNLLDARIALQGNKLNEVMKKVTSWAAIIAVPTAVTGFYGQNVPYPGSGKVEGFVTSTLLLIFCSVMLYIVFKVRDWL